MNRHSIWFPRKRYAVPLLVALLVSLAALLAFAQAPPNIDTFSTVQGPLTATVSTPTASGYVDETPGDGYILREQRDVIVQYVSGTGANVTVDIISDTYSHSQSSNVKGKSTLIYDGKDNNALTTTYNGLCNPSCVNLTQNGQKNAFRFRVKETDYPVDVRIKVYDGSGTDKWSETSFEDLLPGFVQSPIDVFVEFPAILAGTPGASGPANFSSVGAIEIEFDATDFFAADFIIEAIDVGVFDWGDLPEDSCTEYATTYACNGPRHASKDFYLGTKMDPSTPLTKSGEGNGQPSPGANADDKNPSDYDDEDGVAALAAGGSCGTDFWCAGDDGGKISITVTGSGLYWLVGWIDFGEDGFAIGDDDMVINQSVTAGTITKSFRIPANTLGANKKLYGRFRLFPSEPTTPRTAFDGNANASNGQIDGGEVEDYLWIFSPTAVTLAEFYGEQMGDYVRVTWETASELDNLGFNLYRGLSPDEPDRQLNDLLIPSQSLGNPGGFTYTWDDHADLVPGTTYYYWVEDVDVNNVATRHGPVSVDFIVPTAVTLGGLQASPVVGGMALPALWVVAAAGAALGLSRVRRR